MNSSLNSTSAKSPRHDTMVWAGRHGGANNTRSAVTVTKPKVQGPEGRGASDFWNFGANLTIDPVIVGDGTGRPTVPQAQGRTCRRVRSRERCVRRMGLGCTTGRRGVDMGLPGWAAQEPCRLTRISVSGKFIILPELLCSRHIRARYYQEAGARARSSKTNHTTNLDFRASLLDKGLAT